MPENCPRKEQILTGLSLTNPDAAFELSADPNFLDCNRSFCPGPESFTTETSRKKWHIFGPIVVGSEVQTICRQHPVYSETSI